VVGIGELANGFDQGRNVVGRIDDIAVLAVGHDLGRPVITRRDTGQAQHERFQHDATTRIVVGRMNKHIGGVHELLHMLGRSDELNSVGNRELLSQSANGAGIVMADDEGARRDIVLGRKHTGGFDPVPKSLELEVVSDAKCQ